MKRHWLFGSALLAGAVISASLSAPPTASRAQTAATAAPSDALPAWLYPTDTPGAPPSPPDATVQHKVPNSNLSLTMAQITDKFGAPDWHADAHPPMPSIVANGQKPQVWACGYCHLPNGQGRPEDLALAGLRQSYFLKAMADYKSGSRSSSSPAVTSRMIDIAKTITDEQAQQAAQYFEGLTYRPWIRVEEASIAPSYRVSARMMIPIPSKTEPLGERIIEVPADPDRTDLRDDASGFIAYVPAGSLKAGATLAAGGNGIAACAACHGTGLKGGPAAPPLAGRSPTAMLRQLYDFRTGARKGPGAAQMAAIAQKLDLNQMIDLAAYTGSLKP